MAALECQGTRAMSTTRRTVGLAGEAAHERFALGIGGEEALDPELLKRDVVGDAEAGQRREELDANVALGELDGEERRSGRVEVERAPLARHVRIGQELLEQPTRCRAANTAEHVVVQ